MDFSLSAEQRAWQMKARDFAEKEIRPLSLQRDAIADPAQTFDWEIVRKGSKLGFRTVAVPQEWGGAGIDLVTQALVIAELARADSAIAKTFSQSWKWAHLIGDRCTRQQRDFYLKAFVQDDTFVLGGGITEPNAGSDNRLPPDDDIKAGLRLSAQREGDEWVLNGEKCFIANANIGRLFFVYTRTNPDAPLREGTTIFAVPRATPGLRVGKVFNKSGWRFYQNAELIFENVRVPHANLVGELNGAMKPRTGSFGKFSEFEYAANAVGVCESAIDMAVESARNRRRGGRVMIDHQAILLKLSEMHMMTEALRSFVLRVAASTHAEHAGADQFLKNFATDAIQRVCYLNMDIQGSNGGAMSARAEKLVRDAIIWTHIAGDTAQRLAALRPLLT